MNKNHLSRITNILRFGVFGTFIGHGIYAIQVKAEWIKLLTAVGFPQLSCSIVMPIIGIIDLIVAILAIFKPTRNLFIWSTIWCTLTAISRVIAGESMLEILERFSNIACPLALSFISSTQRMK